MTHARGPQGSEMKQGTRDPRASRRGWGVFDLARLPGTQPPANCFRVLPVAGSREGRQSSAGVFCLSLWDIKEDFPGCSGAWKTEEASAPEHPDCLAISLLDANSGLETEEGSELNSSFLRARSRDSSIAPCGLSRLLLATPASRCD